MVYTPTHPRKVRGLLVHQTQIEKNEEKATEGEKRKQEVESIIHQKESTIRQEDIEASYLVPEVDHFVDTPEVRELGGRIKLWIKAGYPVHLIGPTGCGKTTVAMNTAAELGRPVVWINGDESISTTDLIGGYSQLEKESLRDRYVHNVFKGKDIVKVEWIDNPLALACKYGYTLVYNEFSRTMPVANNILLSVFEEGILELPTKFSQERYIKVHPDFNAILTSNSVEYAGVHRPQDALLDRMVGMYMDYYSFDTEVKIVIAHTGLKKHDAEQIVKVVRALREKLSNAQKPGTRASVMIGRGLKALDSQKPASLEHLFIDVMATKTSSPADFLEKQSLVRDALTVLT